MPWLQTGATQYHSQLGFPDKGRAIEGLVVFNDCDLKSLDLLIALALGCYQPSLGIWIIFQESFAKLLKRCTKKEMDKNITLAKKYKQFKYILIFINYKTADKNNLYIQN